MCISLLSYNLIFILCPALQRWQKSNPITPGSEALLLPGLVGGRGACRGSGVGYVGTWSLVVSACADICWDIPSPRALTLVHTGGVATSLVSSYKASLCPLCVSGQLCPALGKACPRWLGPRGPWEAKPSTVWC